MSLWWLQPGWTAARCACGANIWQAGGDPDMGECPDCYEARRQPEQPYPEGPLCDICGQHPACATANGYDVCSQECQDEAARRDKPCGTCGGTGRVRDLEGDPSIPYGTHWREGPCPDCSHEPTR